MLFVSTQNEVPIQQKSRPWHPLIHPYSSIRSLLNNLVQKTDKIFFRRANAMGIEKTMSQENIRR